MWKYPWKVGFNELTSQVNDGLGEFSLEDAILLLPPLSGPSNSDQQWIVDEKLKEIPIVERLFIKSLEIMHYYPRQNLYL